MNHKLIEVCSHCGEDVDITELEEAIKAKTLKEVGKMLREHSCRITKSDVGHWGTILSKEAIDALERGVK